MLPRFIKFTAPNQFSSTEDVVLMKACDHSETEAMYITKELEGYYLFRESDVQACKVPSENDLDCFAKTAIETYRMTKKARVLLDTIKDSLKETVGVDADTAVEVESVQETSPDSIS